MSRIRVCGSIVIILLFCTALLSGCAKPPTEEIAKAEKALEEARAKEVNLYLEDTFKKAEADLKKAKDFVVEKKYKEAKSAVEEAASALQLALSQVDAAKARMKSEADQMARDVQTATNELKTSVAEAVKQKAAISREEAQGLIGKAEVDLLNIKVRLETGKVRVAYDDLKLLKAEIAAQKEKIMAAVTPGQEKK
jgi:murein L,D-transpeptidase YcbB/YkuD